MSFMPSTRAWLTVDCTRSNIYVGATAVPQLVVEEWDTGSVRRVGFAHERVSIEIAGVAIINGRCEAHGSLALKRDGTAVDGDGVALGARKMEEG